MITNEEAIKMLYEIIDNGVIDDDLKDKLVDVANAIQEQ